MLCVATKSIMLSLIMLNVAIKSSAVSVVVLNVGELNVSAPII
jgi:hypothetical protein